MAFVTFTQFGANLDINSFNQGPQLLTPYAYFGNAQKTELGASDDFLKTTVFDDKQPSDVLYPFGHPGAPILNPPTLEKGQQCNKRFHIESNQFKEGDYTNTFTVNADEPGRASLGKTIVANPSNLCPQTNIAQRGIEKYMWGVDAAERVKSNFLLDFDTLDLYCGGAGYAHGAVPVGELGRYGDASQYHDGPFPVRGLPIKFQKVYFYGTRGQISGRNETDKTKPFNDRSQSDGRGALFSTYILCANTAVNSLNPDAGCASGGYDPAELTGYGLEGGSFRYIKSGRAKDYDFYMSGKKEYSKGIDVEWNPESYATDAPLIIGDGALGFREQSLGQDVFGEVDIYQVTSAWKYYNVPITLCTGDGGTLAGTILFRPDSFNKETKRLIAAAKEGGYDDWAEKMVVHDMRNTFSCSGIMPTGDCVCVGCEGEGHPDSSDCATECEYASLTHPNSPLEFQNEKVHIFDNTSILIRTDPEALKDADYKNKCECDTPDKHPCPDNDYY